MIDANVQAEPATSYDVELAGQLAAIGIVHGKEFAPDERMKAILAEAAAVGDAAGRALQWRWADQHPDWAQYEDSQWWSMLWEGGAYFETPPPLFEDGMFKPLPATGARTLDSRTAFYYGYTLDSPGMIMRIPDVGSQYLMGGLDADGAPFDGAKTYKVTLPKDIPARRVLVVHPLRQPDPLDAADAAEVPARRQPELSLAGRRGGRGRLDDGLVRARSSPRAWRAATGSRPTRRRAGSPSCASTARCRRSSTSPGGRARSSRWNDTEAGAGRPLTRAWR